MSAIGGSSDAGRPAPTSDSIPHDTQAPAAEITGVPESNKGLPDLPEGEISSVNKVIHSRRTILPRKLINLFRISLRLPYLVKTLASCRRMQYVNSDLSIQERLTNKFRPSNLHPHQNQTLPLHWSLVPNHYEQTQHNTAKLIQNEILHQMYKHSANTNKNAKKHLDNTLRRHKRRRSPRSQRKRKMMLPEQMMDHRLVRRTMFLLELRSRMFCSTQRPK